MSQDLDVHLRQPIALQSPKRIEKPVGIVISQPQCVHLRKPIGLQTPKRMEKRIVVGMSQHRDVHLRKPDLIADSKEHMVRVTTSRCPFAEIIADQSGWRNIYNGCRNVTRFRCPFAAANWIAESKAD